MAKIIAPTLTLLPQELGGTGELITWTDAISRVYGKEADMHNLATAYSEYTIPDSVKITNEQMKAVVALGGEVKDIPRILCVTKTQLSLPLPSSFPDSSYLDEAGKKVYVKWKDLETAAHKFTLLGGKYYIGSQAVTKGLRPLAATELFGSTTVTALTIAEWQELQPEVTEDV